MIWVSKVMMWYIPLISSHISHHSLSLLTSVLKPASVIWAKQHSVGMIEKNVCEYMYFKSTLVISLYLLCKRSR